MTACWVLARVWNDATRSQILWCLTPDRTTGDPNLQKRSLFLIGDSHAASLSAGARKASEMAGMSFAWIGRGSCGITGECAQDNAAVTRQYQAAVLSALLSQLRAGDIVALLQTGNKHLDAHAMEWYKSTLLPQLREHGSSLVLVYNWPKLPYGYCATQPNKRQCHQHLSGPDKLTRAAEALAAAHKEVHFFTDSSWLFCSSSTVGQGLCGGLVQGTDVMAYADTGHLTFGGSTMFAPYLCSRFEQWGLLA